MQTLKLRPELFRFSFDYPVVGLFNYQKNIQNIVAHKKMIIFAQ
jgi:hypothetical protein